MVEFTHKIVPRSRSLKISIKPSGEVIVTTPRFIPKMVVNRFVHQHQSWIDEQRTKIQAVKHSLQKPSNDSQVLLFGKNYPIEIQIDGKKIGVQKIGAKIVITPIANNEQSLKKALERFLKQEAQTYILDRVEHFGKKMHTTFHQVAFKQQSTRWGSCSSAGNLNFNWRLVHAPEEIIDYVIIHELAHRTHMDHSTQFWKLVEKFDPEYRIHRGWLKRKGMGLN